MRANSLYSANTRAAAVRRYLAVKRAEAISSRKRASDLNYGATLKKKQPETGLTPIGGSLNRYTEQAAASAPPTTYAFNEATTNMTTGNDSDARCYLPADQRAGAPAAQMDTDVASIPTVKVSGDRARAVSIAAACARPGTQCVRDVQRSYAIDLSDSASTRLSLLDAITLSDLVGLDAKLGRTGNLVDIWSIAFVGSFGVPMCAPYTLAGVHEARRAYDGDVPQTTMIRCCAVVSDVIAPFIISDVSDNPALDIQSYSIIYDDTFPIERYNSTDYAGGLQGLNLQTFSARIEFKKPLTVRFGPDAVDGSGILRARPVQNAVSMSVVGANAAGGSIKGNISTCVTFTDR